MDNVDSFGAIALEANLFDYGYLWCLFMMSDDNYDEHEINI